MKKKVLLTSITTIILCVSIIAGATFALFTDDTKFNVSVTSGDVEIEAYAKINSVWSAYGEGVTKAEDEYLIDENNHFYVHGKRDPIDGRYIFTNGGEAVLDGANLVINRITPGDRVDVDINVTNKSDVAIAYRYKLVAKDTNLATGMVVTIDGVSYEGLSTWTSEWYDVITAPDGKGNEIPVKTISVELPVYAGNEYQTEYNSSKNTLDDEIQSVSYDITVEAVQGNAVTDNESLVTIFPAAFQKMMNERDVVTTHGGTLDLKETLELANNSTTIVNSVINGKNADAGDATVPFLVWGGDLTLGAGTTVTAADYGVFVMGGDKLTLDAGSKLIVTDGTIAAINGQVATSVFELYLNDTGLIVDEAGNVADTKISLLCGGTFKIYVPTLEAYNEYSKMVDTDTTYQKIEWYIDGKPVATDAEGLKGALADASVSYVYVDEDIAGVVVENASNKTIDANGHDVGITFTGTVNNVVVKNVVKTTGGNSINVKNATGTVKIIDSTFTSGTANAAAAIVPGSNCDIEVDNCDFYGGKYSLYGYSESGDITITNSDFYNFTSWAIQVNSKVNANIVVDGCTFNNCQSGLIKVLSTPDNGYTFTFTNNTVTASRGHDGKEAEWLWVSSGYTIISSGNTLDGATWTPGSAQGLGR